MKYGIFVGSFNPITKAHLEIKDYLINNKIVDKIIYLPINNQRKKRLDINIRINMLNLIIDNFSEIDNIMLNYDKFNYLVINELEKKYDNMYFILGTDVYKYFHTFDQYEELLKKYHYIVINRDDAIKTMDDNIIFVDYHNNISSTKVRELIRKKMDYSNYVDNRIEKYIKEHNLYIDNNM